MNSVDTFAYVAIHHRRHGREILGVGKTREVGRSIIEQYRKLHMEIAHDLNEKEPSKYYRTHAESLAKPTEWKALSRDLRCDIAYEGWRDEYYTVEPWPIRGEC